eukprot:TRINITY_DN777_c0_g2_i18.p1 TRINITY_DN777_c0_g2~~TRINITY_DN777_c0_g2_i18.p1  ORF type:complete len:210 (-),score=40.55 TRINITY_DN777_c0_g2_i18:313-915(-)
MGCCYGKRNGDVQIELLTQGGNIQVTQECGTHKLESPIKENAATANHHQIHVITREEIDAAPRLVLEVLESPTLAKGTAFEINAAGYTHSKRNANDGFTYMGTAEHGDNSEEPPNDIVISTDEIGMGTTHLVIQYKPETKGYFIRDYGQGTGTFVKIERPIIIQEGFIISYGESHMHVSALNAEKIQLKFLDGPKAEQIL